jgi:hypothetical protein
MALDVWQAGLGVEIEANLHPVPSLEHCRRLGQIHLSVPAVQAGASFGVSNRDERLPVRERQARCER